MHLAKTLLSAVDRARTPDLAMSRSFPDRDDGGGGGSPRKRGRSNGDWDWGGRWASIATLNGRSAIGKRSCRTPLRGSAGSQWPCGFPAMMAYSWTGIVCEGAPFLLLLRVVIDG
jgi:hypothetical protein